MGDDGRIKPFNRFLNEVQRIHQSYNVNYLRTEYNLAQASSLMAARWKQFEQDGDRYLLQYRTVGDKRVRRSHRMLHGITLPITSKFWNEYFPPNNWNCRCTVVQVRKGKYPESNEQEAMKLGMEATAGKYREMFLFNPGKSMTCFPAYNAYTRRKCIHCKHRPGNMELAAEIDADALCHVCLQTQQEVAKNDNLYYKDEEFGDRLLISVKADKTEIEDNTKAAKSLLRSFSDMEVVIREHIIEKGVKNPEYLINGVLADRKGIESENGVASGFKKAIKQGCNIVVIDLDKNADKFPILRTRKLSSSINNRHADFENGSISECYVIFNGKAVKIGKELFNNNIMTVKENIYNILEKIKGDRSHP